MRRLVIGAAVLALAACGGSTPTYQWHTDTEVRALAGSHCRDLIASGQTYTTDEKCQADFVRGYQTVRQAVEAGDTYNRMASTAGYLVGVMVAEDVVAAGKH